MSDYGRLAMTGMPTLTIFGVVLDQWWIAGLAVLLIVIAIVALRVGFRRGKDVSVR